MSRKPKQPDVIINCQGGENWPPLVGMLLQGECACIIDANGESIPLDGAFELNMTQGKVRAFLKDTSGKIVFENRKPIIQTIHAAGPLSLRMKSGEVVSEYRIRQAYIGLQRGLDGFMGQLQLERGKACHKLSDLIRGGLGKDLAQLMHGLEELGR